MVRWSRLNGRDQRVELAHIGKTMLTEIAPKGAFTKERMGLALCGSRINSFIKVAHKLVSFHLRHCL